ncbi:MAG: hypothetical protein DWH98_04255 [Planctomycetota bacterium]|nr:MAG: hypothetical protein DWH98_04255 [Planctomycetota bacterium]
MPAIKTSSTYTNRGGIKELSYAIVKGTAGSNRGLFRVLHCERKAERTLHRGSSGAGGDLRSRPLA